MTMSLGMVLGCLVNLMAGCGENETTTARRAETVATAKDPAPAAATARQGVSRLLADGALQVELGRLAPHGAKTRTRDNSEGSGRHDHSRLREEYAAWRTSRDQLDRLLVLSGDAFDRAYMLAAVSKEGGILETREVQASDRAEKTGGGGPSVAAAKRVLSRPGPLWCSRRSGCYSARANARG
jgi:predicted outer membrane protein